MSTPSLPANVVTLVRGYESRHATLVGRTRVCIYACLEGEVKPRAFHAKSGQERGFYKTQALGGRTSWFWRISNQHIAELQNESA